MAVGLLLVYLPLLPVVGVLAGTAVLLLIFIDPLLGLALALLAGPLGAAESLYVQLGPLDSGQILLLLTTASWLAKGLAARRVQIPRSRLTLPLLLYILLTAVTLLGARSLPVGLRELLKWVEIWLVMVMVADLGNGRTVWVLAAVLLAGVSQGLLGIWQFGLRGDGPEHFLVLGRFYRAFGTFNQPNPFGGFMNLSALLALGVLLGLAAWGWQERHRLFGDGGQGVRPYLAATVLVGIVAIITTLGLLFSWSRGAWLGFAAGTAVLLFFGPTQRKWGVLLGLAVLVLSVSAWQAGLVPASVADRITGFSQDLTLGDVRGVDINDTNFAVLERLAHWQAAIGMAQDHLWLGVGFGNYEPAYADYDLINWPAPLGHAHNYYLNLLAETGVIGLAAYLLLWTAVFWLTWQQLNRTSWPSRGIALGLLAVWTAMAVHHLVDKLYVNNMYVHLGVLFGVLVLLENGRSNKQKL
ncbi:MAG: O-antigen ligase family protein [Candidatus Promineifilaceae bacterium]